MTVHVVDTRLVYVADLAQFDVIFHYRLSFKNFETILHAGKVLADDRKIPYLMGKFFVRLVFVFLNIVIVATNNMQFADRQ